ncbi:DUF3558 family protein [Actinokineospora inagensis]|uniref:DUF3558 family protein n=1 Tax=Actinokineospora inagensis TaxID=103730 RepID=UPI0003FE7BC1|nr:DUF3558 family protein [Actinokineospora inagensis]
MTLASCSTETTTGYPISVDTATGVTGAPSKSTAPQTSIKPCTLLSAADIARLGITGVARPEESKGTISCTWRVEPGTASDGYNIDVTFYKELGLKDLVTSQAKTISRLGKHDTINVLGDEGSGRVVAIGISPTSRVDVFVAGGEQTKLCKPAQDTADVIEPKLP